VNRRLSNKSKGLRTYAVEIPSRDEVLGALEEAGVPLSDAELLERLGVKDGEEREGIERRIGAMEREGQVLRNRRLNALVCDLVHWLWPLWLRRCRTGQLTEALTLALAAAQLTHSERATAAMLIALADAARTLNPAAAYGYARRAAAHCEQTGETAGLAAALSSLGSTLLHTGQFDHADGCFRDAEALHATLGRPRGVALARRGRGLIALERGDTEAAVELLDDAHRALAQVGDRHEAALTLALHARALAADGDVRHALLELDLAAGVLREMRATDGEAAVFSTRADVLAHAGLETQARQARAKARSLRRATAPCAEHQNAETSHAC